jgi:hypothetical protein
MYEPENRFLIFFCFLLISLNVSGQQTSGELKTEAWNLHSLRAYPFEQKADSLMQKVIENLSEDEFPTDFTFKTTEAFLVYNRKFIENPASTLGYQGELLQKYVIKPYSRWFDFSKQVGNNPDEYALPVFTSADSLENCSAKGLFDYFGAENIAFLANEYLGKIDLAGKNSETLFLSVKSPLAKDAATVYRYFYSANAEIDGVPALEIAFYPRNRRATALEGFIYLSVKELKPVKAVLTLNRAVATGNVKEVLFIQTPALNEAFMYFGDEIRCSLFVHQSRSREKPRSGAIIDGFLAEAEKTRAYKNVENLLIFALFDRIKVAGGLLEMNHITQMLSFNDTEGFRLRAGLNTSDKLSRRWRAGGYAAFGTRDREWKYGGELAFKPNPASRLALTYIRDLNIPGYNLEESRRDMIFYSIYHSKINNFSLQKLGKLSYEKDFKNWFSLKFDAKYLYDKPIGAVEYIFGTPENPVVKNALTSSDIGISVRYSPKERKFISGGEPFVFHEADFEVKLSHRAGLKGVLNSDYAYHKTEFSVFRRLHFPLNKGFAGFELSGGKVWNRLPFPLLFIPSGNQSYVYDPDSHNLMDFYEFVTDRFVKGNLNLNFRWSPVKLFFPRNGICTNIGLKAIYGPLSDNNNPALHPELFIFNNGVQALGKTPYAEASIGFSEIFGFLRLDYVRRLTYSPKGGIFVSAVFSL